MVSTTKRGGKRELKASLNNLQKNKMKDDKKANSGRSNLHVKEQGCCVALNESTPSVVAPSKLGPNCADATAPPDIQPVT